MARPSVIRECNIAPSDTVGTCLKRRCGFHTAHCIASPRYGRRWAHLRGYEPKSGARTHSITSPRNERSHSIRSVVARVTVLTLVLVALLLLSGGGTQAQQEPAFQKVILWADDPATRQAWLARGARLLADYDAFSLWMAPAAELNALSEPGARWSIHPEFDQLLLRAGTMDTRALTNVSSPAADQGYQLRLLQFVGPVRDEWLADLEATGAQIVAYIPHNGYVVWADENARARIEQRVAEQVEYQWQGPYQPVYRLDPSLRQADSHAEVDVVVQVVRHAQSKQTVNEIRTLAQAVLRAPEVVSSCINLTLRVPAWLLPTLVSRPDVFNVELWQSPSLADERQGQILAGNLNSDATQPSGPGYLAWLNGLGLSQDPGHYFIVDVIDDGFDNGDAAAPAHPDFYLLGLISAGSRVVYARDLTSDGNPRSAGGHGTLNESILGGYNDRAGLAYQDAGGYSYGLGISPYGRLASSKVFNDQGAWAYTGSLTDLIRGSFQSGARITNDSWSSAGNAYTADAQAFDALTRDADPLTPGNQSMLHVVVAGNGGPTASTIDVPGTAKNVVTVGASENVRSGGADGCGFGNSMANNAQDIAAFSGRGPTSDGRIKPDLVAPGTHIQGAASQDAAYDANGICNQYWPAGQTLYTWSSGTSHAAPAVAGALSLLSAHLQDTGPVGGDPPSPAMLKAYLLNSARYISGAYPGETLPSPNQGFGRADLGRALDGVPRMRIDQNVLLASTGQQHVVTGVVVDPTQPFRVTLAWTDAPGSTTAAAWVNNLDLQVTVGGQTYLGNVFSGSTSIPGGTADAKNNVESVHLLAGTTGAFTVRITAANLAGDGLPGNGDSTDQDFALVIYNAVPAPDFQVGISPSSAEVCREQAITYTVSVTGLWGYASSVSLTHNEPPADVQFTLTPASGIPTFGATLQAAAGPSATVGSYLVAITGTGMQVHTATASLAVDAVAPLCPALMGPADGAVNVAVRPTFTWAAAANARSYRVQVAGDDAFSGLVVDQVVNSTSFVLARDLYTDQTYYWRVIAQNGCAVALCSPPWTFTTVNLAALFYDTVEQGSVPWTVDTPIGTARWQIRGDRWHSASHAWHMEDYSGLTDARLVIVQTLQLTSTSTLSFWNWYDMEATETTAWDGGVLEISLNGGEWQDLGILAVSGGYGHTVSAGLGNPLAGKRAWSGRSQGWQRVQIDLASFAGSQARIRFRWGGDRDNMTTYAGWYVDDIQVTTIWPPSRYKQYLSLVFR